MKKLSYKKCQIISLIYLVALVISCSKDEVAKETILTAQTTSAIPNTATSQFLNVLSNGTWKLVVNYVSGGNGWISVTPTSGTGDANMVLQIAQNPTFDIRTAEIVITCAEKEVKLPITQQASVLIGGRTTNTIWTEIPSGGGNSDCITFTHDITIGTKTVRNYSMMYDKKEKLAYWVAYPHHSSYLGSTARTDNWKPDPMVALTSQPDYFSSVSGYDRGHQIPSADRTVSNIANSQTFYFTNMTPQLSVLNGNMWASLEGQVRTWMAASDTLYVVTGAVLKTVGGNETVTYATDSKGSKMAVPNYYYKVLLRLKSGKYDGIGFWFEHRSYGSGNATAAVTKTVRQIETLTGFNFFSALPKTTQDDAESATILSAWGL